ncbi:hypothetical protein NX773_14410 [Massilia solisilvae]|uniref:DarT domain-containing protein n=1 Tax=Massilia solisilvae TaxID=1811225 RepID=A0ABT2BMR3_9BURK|nr:hypothetical protein [Massilia solisilvae]MCS0609360.1 hypothetical protein [Massilia solisilvae]
MHDVASKREIRIAYHLVDIRNLKSIQAHGLLSTQRLVELSTNVNRSMLRQHRPEEMHLDFGAFIRDQSTMQRKSIERALRSGVTPEDWFELLNSKVFFWLDLDSLNCHRAACKNQKQVVLAIDVRRMLDEYAPLASVSPINSGHAMRSAAPRNLSTFVPYEKWVESGWDSEQVPGISRRGSLWPAELAITGQIPDIARFVIGSVYWDASEALTERHIATQARVASNE